MKNAHIQASEVYVYFTGYIVHTYTHVHDACHELSQATMS